MNNLLIYYRWLRFICYREVGNFRPMLVMVACFVVFLFLINWLDAHGLNWVNNSYRY